MMVSQKNCVQCHTALYVTIDDAINRILTLGPGSLLAPFASYLFIHCHLLAMRWDDWIFIDTWLPFGLRSAPKLFNIMADMLTREQGIIFVIHYLDDFLTIGPSGFPECG